MYVYGCIILAYTVIIDSNIWSTFDQACWRKLWNLGVYLIYRFPVSVNGRRTSMQLVLDENLCVSGIKCSYMATVGTTARFLWRCVYLDPRLFAGCAYLQPGKLFPTEESKW